MRSLSGRSRSSTRQHGGDGHFPRVLDAWLNHHGPVYLVVGLLLGLPLKPFITAMAAANVIVISHNASIFDRLPFSAGPAGFWWETRRAVGVAFAALLVAALVGQFDTPIQLERVTVARNSAPPLTGYLINEGPGEVDIGLKGKVTSLPSGTYSGVQVAKSVSSHEPAKSVVDRLLDVL